MTIKRKGVKAIELEVGFDEGVMFSVFVEAINEKSKMLDYEADGISVLLAAPENEEAHGRLARKEAHGSKRFSEGSGCSEGSSGHCNE